MSGESGLMQEPSPWQPENDKVHLAVLGKTGEEAGELVSALFRCVIQGVDGKHPVTGKSNRDWLQDELADVLAGIHLTVDRFNLDYAEITRRCEMKKQHKRKWYKLIKE